MQYVIRNRCYQEIEKFYRNVARKYRHTYSIELMQKNVLDATNAIYYIEKTLLRRRPTLSRWQGFHMAHAGHWYYAYTITDDTVIIEDACHELNMTENSKK